MLVPANVVSYLLSIGPPKFQIPAIVTMTIAATRMHRSLVNFATPVVCAIPHIYLVRLIMINAGSARTQISK